MSRPLHQSCAARLALTRGGYVAETRRNRGGNEVRPGAGATDFFENLPMKMGLSRVLSADLTHGIATNHRVEVPQNAERNCYKTPNG